MNDDFRRRAFLPVVIPLGIIAVVLGAIGLYAWMLLYTTAEGASAVAIMSAAGILVAATLASSHDSLDRAKQVGVALAVLGPIGIGALIAGGVLNLDPATLNINAQPHGPEFLLSEVPDDAPLMAAESLNSFCLPTDGGGCEETNEWTIESTEEMAEVFTYAFDNRDAVEHNLAIFGLPEEGAFGSNTEQLGTESLTPEIPDTFPGPEVRAYQFEWPAPEEGGEPAAPEQFYFVCTVHPSTMYGVATIEG